ncbi:MAG: DUF4240 domain-containing protein [Planctomycetes bacterium]|nr:DUF4240 domain-containing protein [Planctomycetota bacterium]
MTTEQFWRLIDESRMAATPENPQFANLEKSIRALPTREMVFFEGHCWDLLSLSLKRELWAVATIIQPSCTQYSFDAVRAWIILEGKEFFEAVVANPEKLADRVPRGRIPWIPNGEMLLRLVPRVYRSLTGEDLPTLPRKVPYVLKGVRWTEFDLPELYPALWKKYRGET